MTHVNLGLNGLEFKLFLLSVLKEKESSEQEKCRRHGGPFAAYKSCLKVRQGFLASSEGPEAISL